VNLESIGIINALRRGTVPGSGLARIAVGLELEEDVIGRQLEFVAEGGGDLKFVRGDYGAGKTFLVARALEIARMQGFVTSQVTISPSCPLHKLNVFYQQVCASLRTREEEHAQKAIIDSWIFAIEERILSAGQGDIDDTALERATIREIEAALAGISELNSALAAALRIYYLANNAGDFPLAQAATGWIMNEPNIGRAFKQKAGIRGTIDDTVALAFLKGLIRVITGAGYRGLAVAIDEADTVQVLPRASREKGYQTIRQFIELLDRGEMPRLFLLVTGTPSFFEGPRGIRMVPSLYDRIGISPDDRFRNPRQPQIVLARFNDAKLEKVALRVVEIYAAAYREVDRGRISHRFIRAMIKKLTTKFGGRVDVIPRIFLKEFIDVLDKCELYEDYDPWEAYEFDASHLQGDLRNEEEAVMTIAF
jgi:adenosylhomocysteinase